MSTQEICSKSAVSVTIDEGEQMMETNPINQQIEDNNNDSSNTNNTEVEDDERSSSIISHEEDNNNKSFIMELVEKRGPSMILLLITLFAMAFGSTIGIVPAIMTDRYARLNHGYDSSLDCGSYISIKDKPEECLLGSADAQDAAAYANLVSNCFTFLMASLLGAMSDEYGRRDILISGLFLSCTSTVCLVLMQMRPMMSPNWYYIASASSGLISWFPICLSSLSDVLSPKWRAAGFGLFLASFSVGIALSPIIAIFFNHFHVSVVSLGMLILALSVVFFFFPETLPPAAAEEAKQTRIRRDQQEQQQQRATRCFGSNILYTLKRPIRELSILNRNTFFRLLALLAFFSGMVAQADQSLLLYYLEDRLAFNDKDVAKMFVLIGVLGILVQGILIKPFIQFIGEKHVIVMAFIIGSLVNVLYGIASEKWMIFAALPLGSFVGMSFPTISAIKSNNVKQNEQGRIQGALSSVQALASGAGPMALRVIFRFTQDTVPGAMWLFAAFLYLIATGFALTLPSDKANSTTPWLCKRRRRDGYDEVDDDGQQRSVEEALLC